MCVALAARGVNDDDVSTTSPKMVPKASEMMRWTDNARTARANAGIPVCSPWRVATELLCLAFFASWGLNLAAYMFLPQCSHFVSTAITSSSNLGNSAVLLRAAHTGLVVRVDELSAEPNNILGLEAETVHMGNETRRQTFQLERVDDTWFCLRWLHNMQLVEVVPAGTAGAFTLRVGTNFSCTSPLQKFSLRGQSGRSLFSNGVHSFVQVRDTWHLRAHGDTKPWAPLTTEKKSSLFEVQTITKAQDDYHARLLAVIRALEMGASAASKEHSARHAALDLVAGTGTLT